VSAERAVTPPVARLPRDFHTAWATKRLSHCNKPVWVFAHYRQRTASSGPYLSVRSNSTRRLIARPSSVLLSLFGLVSSYARSLQSAGGNALLHERVFHRSSAVRRKLLIAGWLALESVCPLICSRHVGLFFCMIARFMK